MSGVAHYSHLRDWGFMPDTSQSIPLTQPFLGSEGLAATSALTRTDNMTSDSYQDIEPSVIAYNSNGTIYRTTAYVKILTDGITPRNYYSTTADYTTFYKGALALPSGYTRSADPLMAKNAYNGGIAPGKIYLSGIVYNPNPPGTNTFGAPNGIAVWRSDDGGRNWSQPSLASVNTDSAYFLDKPAVAVSWHSASLGYVYVAYTKFNYTGTIRTLYVAKSIDGGLTFSASVAVGSSTSNAINGAQVLVNKNYGHVYVLWTDFTAKKIYMSTSTNYGQSWSAAEIVAAGNMFKANINGGVKVGSLPMARFNWVANKICVVWTEHESATSTKTDIYYTAKGATGGWQTKVLINDVVTNDQFMPALDFDTTGNMAVTFYDRRDDINNKLYHLYMARINSNGQNLQPNARISTFQSNPAIYTQYQNFIGDYQDLWDQSSGGENYYSAWVGIPSTGDIFMSVIVP